MSAGHQDMGRPGVVGHGRWVGQALVVDGLVVVIREVVHHIARVS